MKSKKIIHAIVIIVALFEIWFYLGTGYLWPALYYPADGAIRPVTVMQSGGSSLLAADCADKNYIENASDYIIEGLVENAESRWNEKRTDILTYTDLKIENYIKGTPFEESTNEKLKVVATHLTIITPGGCAGDICQEVEDQPTLHKGKTARIYFNQEVDRQLNIVCGNMGVEDLHR